MNRRDADSSIDHNTAAQDRAPRFGETSEAGSVPDTKEGTNEGRDKSPDVCSDRDPRFLETSAMGSLPDNKEGRDEGHEVGPGRSRGSSDERTGSDGNAGLRPGPTATFCECPPETPASYIDGAPGGAYCDECDKPVRPKASAASPSFRERFEQSHSPQDYLNWLNDYTNTKGRGDDELHALCSWAYSVIAALQNELATREPNQAVMNRRAER